MLKIPLKEPQASVITLHNADEVIAEGRGLTPYRVSCAWRERFPEQTAVRATQAAGVELRFRADTRYLAVDLAIRNQLNYRPAVALYHGERAVGLVSLPQPTFEGHVVLLDGETEVEGVLEAPWRILCPYGAVSTVEAIYLSDGAELLPAASRAMRWLAHGDSITQGAHALSPGMTYVHLAADALGWDALNLGFGGSAWGDAVVAEYIANRPDWDVLSIAIGTNTYGGSRESAAAYAKRYDRFLDIVRRAHPRKPILCITPIWRKQDGPPEAANLCGDPPRAYREAITQVVRSRQPNDPHLALLDGLTLIGGPRGLGVDLVHPDDHGMNAMAQGIATALSLLAGGIPLGC